MPHIIEITDLSATELNVFTHLTEAQLRSRCAPERALFIAEGPRVIGHALDAGYKPVSLLTGRRQSEDPARGTPARCGNVPLCTVGRDTLAVLTSYKLTRGVLCAVRRPSLPAMEELCAGVRRAAVLEGTVGPTNVGVISHPATALHMDGVLIAPTCRDPLYRRTMRVSMGTVFQIPWTYIGARSADQPQPRLARLRALGFQAAATAPSPRALSIEDFRLVFVEKLAIVPDIEGDGFPPRAVTHYNYTACIPMARGVDPLNVAAASAVAFWQLGRYKRTGNPWSRLAAPGALSFCA